jgi:hypothetical protein
MQRARPSTATGRPSAQRERLLWLLLLLRRIPQITQSSAATAHRLHLALLPARRGCELRGRWLSSLWIGWEPLRKWPALFCVVCAQTSRDVRVVFRVPVRFAVEELPPEVVVP